MVTQREIGEWHRRAFPDATDKDVGVKLLEEAAEAYIEQVGLPRSVEKLRVELADVLIVIKAIAERAGLDLETAECERFENVKTRYPVR